MEGYRAASGISRVEVCVSRRILEKTTVEGESPVRENSNLCLDAVPEYVSTRAIETEGRVIVPEG